MTIYELTLTEKALATNLAGWDYNIKHAIIANSRVQARMLAGAASRDEPAHWWREKEFSTLRAIGYAPKAEKAYIVCSEYYSHG